MLYAKVVFGLNIQCPFDYFVPPEFLRKIMPGARVEVYLRNRKKTGYVVGLSKKTDIQNTRPILRLLDDSPILDKNMLLLTKEISDYYCCAWGEAIELALPEGLRKGKSICIQEESLRPVALAKGGQTTALRPKGTGDVLLLQDIDGKARWAVYLEEIKEAVNNEKGVLILLPDKNCVLGAKQIIEKSGGFPIFHPEGFNENPDEESRVSILSKENPKTELEEWIRIKSARANIVLGSRSAVFAPVSNLGLIIVDEEEDSVYKQDQSPHYNARQAALMRAEIEKARLVLCSTSPSLESFRLARENKIKYRVIPGKRAIPEIKLIDLKSEYYLIKKRNAPISRYFIDSISSSLGSGPGDPLSGESAAKVLLFLNRRGFATYGSCHNCGRVLKCPRCSINLVYHFQENQLICHYCNFKMETAKICPNCNSGYIKFAGLGIEKIESELSRLFPSVRIKRIEKAEQLDINAADIFITTSSIIKHASYPEIINSSASLARGSSLDGADNNAQRRFDLIGVLSIDNSLNRIDLRSAEKTFALLTGLLKLTDKKIIIQTSFPGHPCFQALLKKNPNMFYEEELKQRKQLGFPPYRHMVKVLLRGRNEEKVKKAGNFLFDKLKEGNKDKGIHLLSVGPGQPLKLRAKFYWQILIISCNVKKVSRFLKLRLKKLPFSGIIVTVDVDPV